MKKSIGKTIQKASKRKKKTPQHQAVKAISGSTNKMAKKSLCACTSTSKSVQRDLPQLDDSTEASMSPTSVTGSSTSGLPTITATLNRRILSIAPATSVLSPTTSVSSPTTSVLSPSTSVLGYSTSVFGSTSGICSPVSSYSGLVRTDKHMLLDQHQGLFTKLMKIESQQDKILEGQKEIITLLSGSNLSQKKGNRKVKICVPNHVRTAVHDGFSHGTSMGLQWNVKSNDGNQTLKPSSDVNKEMTEHICQYVLGIYPDCKAFVKDAINRYVQSMQDKERRIRKGRVDSFKKGMVLYQRKKKGMS